MRENPTPKARALGRKLTTARECAQITQKQLATALGVSEPYLSRLLSGKRPSPTATVYSILAGILIGNLQSGQAAREDLLHSLEYLTGDANDTKWITHRQEERHIQHQAFLHELRNAATAVTVWPTTLPEYYPLPDDGEFTILAGEPITDNPDDVDRLGFLAGQGARIGIVPATLIHHHNLDSPVTLLIPVDVHLRFVYVDGRFTGTFLHHPPDVRPIADLLHTLSAAAEPLTPRILTADDSDAIATAVVTAMGEDPNDNITTTPR